MSEYPTLLGSFPSAPAPKPPQKPRASTFIVGAITALFMLLGALNGGVGGALIFLAISVALTGLYVLVKGDGDAATWLPPNKGFRCEYVARQISVKATYSLWVTQAEHDAMARILADCAGQLAPTDQKAPVVAEPAPAAPAPAAVQPAPVAPAPAAPAPAPAPAPVAPAPAAPAPVAPAPVAPAPAAAYYPNCAAARAAGAAPLYAGQAGYRSALDRDADGIACE